MQTVAQLEDGDPAEQRRYKRQDTDGRSRVWPRAVGAKTEELEPMRIDLVPAASGDVRYDCLKTAVLNLDRAAAVSATTWW